MENEITKYIISKLLKTRQIRPFGINDIFYLFIKHYRVEALHTPFVTTTRNICGSFLLLNICDTFIIFEKNTEHPSITCLSVRNPLSAFIYVARYTRLLYLAFNDGVNRYYI